MPPLNVLLQEILNMKFCETFSTKVVIKIAKAPRARPALPKNDRENELLVEMMGKAKGVWIHAQRKGNAIYGIRKLLKIYICIPNVHL